MKLERQRISDEIPTSSTADIAFLLVVFFMITVTFAASKGLDFKLPADDPVLEVDPVESVMVEIGRDAQLLVDRRPMELDDLLGYLAPKLARDPTKPVIIRPDPDAPYGAMVAVYDELRRGKAELNLTREIQVALPTEREITQFWQ